MADGRFVITRLKRSMVATLEGSIDAGALETLVDSLSGSQAWQVADSVVFDVSACEVMDLGEFERLQKAVRTVELLGLRCVVAGLGPGVVAYIATSGVESGGLRTAIDLELALEELRAEENDQEPEPEPESHYDTEPDREPDGVGPF